MAYVLPQQDDEEQQAPAMPAAPKLGGAAPAGPAPSQGQTAQQQQNTDRASSAQSKGSGFTNLSNWLSAGKGRDQNITKTGGDLLGKEQNAFDAAAAPVKNASFQAAGNAAEMFGRGDDAGAAAAMNQTYKGPRDVNYDANAQKNVWDARALGQTNQVGGVLARPAVEAGQYGAGMQRLDNVLFGADSSSQKAIGDQATATKGFETKVGTEKAALGEKVAGLDKQAEAANATARGQLKDVYGQRLAGLDAEVGRRNAADAKTRAEVAAAGGNLVWDPTTNGWRQAAEGQRAAEWTGGGATRENTVGTWETDNGFARLNKLLNGETPTVQATGTYESAKRGAEADPNFDARGHDPWTGEKISDQEAAGRGTNTWMRAKMDRNNPDGVYQQALAEGLTQQQADSKAQLWANYIYQEYPELAPSNNGSPSYAAWLEGDGAQMNEAQWGQLAGTKYEANRKKKEG